MGNRARKYLAYLDEHPDAFRVAALVEPSLLHREAARMQYGLPEAACFADADSFFAERRPVDAVLITSPDQAHFPQALRAASYGYHILLEKPSCQSEAECRELLKAVQRAGIVACGCYVLRYHPLYRRIKTLLEEGRIGRLTAIRHRIRIGRDRMGHSFVRGPWGSTRETSPIFLSKCCHDVDILLWMSGVHPTGVSSEGGRQFFRAEKAPEGSTERCMDCPLQESCLYSATDLYLRRGLWTDSFFPAPGETKEAAVRREVRTGRYGRCVWRSDNDVADFQRVRVQTREGVDMALEMDGLALEEGRRTVLCGTQGRILADGGVICVETFAADGTTPADCERIDLSAEMALPFHAGADIRLVEDFLSAVNDPAHKPLTALSDTMDSLAVCFAAG